MTAPITPTSTLLNRQGEIRTSLATAKADRCSARKAGDAVALREARAHVETYAEILEEMLQQQAEPLLTQRATLLRQQAVIEEMRTKNRSLTNGESAQFNSLGNQIEDINAQLRQMREAK